MDLVVASSLFDLVASSPVYGVSPEVPVAARWSGKYRSSRSATSSVSRRRGGLAAQGVLFGTPQSLSARRPGS